MRRRRFIEALGLAAAFAASPIAPRAHTPYGQWVIYRKKHLVIGCHREDPATFDLARGIADWLASELPEASARVARAPRASRIASLIATDQMDVAVLSEPDALAMQAGLADFAPYGAVELRLLAQPGPRLMVCHPRMPDRHAWLIASAMYENGDVSPSALDADLTIPLHPGVRAFLDGSSISDLPVEK